MNTLITVYSGYEPEEIIAIEPLSDAGLRPAYRLLIKPRDWPQALWVGWTYAEELGPVIWGRPDGR